MKQPNKRFALCVDNTDYAVSLIVNKVYAILPDPADLLRIVDESGEDYLYHQEEQFLPARISGQAASRAYPQPMTCLVASNVPLTGGRAKG
jgi:hypothetical protein